MDHAAFKLPPFAERKVAVTFAPKEAGLYTEKLVISSNATNNGSLELSLAGSALAPPVAATDPASFSFTVAQGQPETVSLTIDNEKGGSELSWKMRMRYTHAEPTASEVSTSDFGLTAEGEAHRKASPFRSGTHLVYHPEKRRIYSIESNTNTIYEYYFDTNRWAALAQNTNNRNYRSKDVALLDDKIYIIHSPYYSSDVNVQIYDLKEKEWSSATISNQGYNPLLLTSDGNQLYVLFQNNTFVAYDEDLNELEELATTTSGSQYQNILYHDSFIYAHGYNSLWSYSLEEDRWNQLPAPPHYANSESAIDPLSQSIHVSNAQNWMIYDIEEQKWYSAYNDLLNTSNFAHMTYVGYEEHSGIYFLSQSIFGQFETNPNWQWLSLGASEGRISQASTQSVDLRINTNNLPIGRYGGTLTLSTNDPNNPLLQVPVRLTVTDADEPDEDEPDGDEPLKNEPPVVADSLSDQLLTLRTDAYTINLAPHFEDPESYPLSYLISARQNGVVTTQVTGSVLAINPQSLGETTLDIEVKDIGGLSVVYRIKVTIEPDDEPQSSNLPPLAMLEQLGYEMAIDEYLSFGLDTLFSDPEGDALAYQFSISDLAMASVEVSAEGMLKVLALQPGEFTITLTATDPEGGRANTALSAKVIQPQVFGSR